MAKYSYWECSVCAEKEFMYDGFSTSGNCLVRIENNLIPLNHLCILDADDDANWKQVKKKDTNL